MIVPTRAQSLAALSGYETRMREAITADRHHDDRRKILIELLRQGFDLTVDEIELEHNVQVAMTRGRIDLLYRSLAWEVKRNLDRERDDLERELKLYLTDLGERAFGIGTDGLRFEVYQLDEQGELRQTDSYDIDAPTATLEEALDWLDAYVFAIEQVPPTTESILARFGLDSAVFLTAQLDLQRMWDEVGPEDDASVKRNEWERLLEVVYGTQIGSDELWLRHTYLVMVARLLAYLAITEHLPPQGEELGALTGDLFTPLGLQNLVERDFFSWPALPEAAGSARALLRGLAHHLGFFSLGDVDEDLLKQLYEQMVDPAEREWLGEFYTPDWLADLMLERAGFSSESRMLDPSCGSGTFLFSAIRRLRNEGLRGRDLVTAAQRSVVGLDIHPVAITTSRANYVLALRSDVRDAQEALTIPVFMADTLAAPEAGFGRVVEIRAPVDGLDPGLPGMFRLPTERDEQQIAGVGRIVELVDQLSDPALDGERAEAGLATRLEEWGVRSQVQTWEENLRLLRALRANHRDTIWSFVLTNAARPHEIAAEPVDLVIGNPPWLTVMEMAGVEYKERVKRLAAEFQLVARGGRRMADISHIDTSTVFAAFCAEHFLPAEHGRVAFVLPRAVMAGARQHTNFRQGRAVLSYSPVAAIDLDGVAPLFRIPACVMTFDKVPAEARPAAPWRWDTTALEGELPRKNASRAEADAALTESDVGQIDTEARPSPYLVLTKQGVDIRPRAFWLVEPDPDARVLDRAQPFLRSEATAAARAHPLWRGVSITGRIEAQYLYATSLEVDPYRIGPLHLVALPINPVDGGGVRIVSEAEILERGDAGMARWVAQAEQEFRSGLKRAHRIFPGSVIDYLNTQQKLADQLPTAPRIVWAAGGTHIRAAVPPDALHGVHGLAVQGYVIDLNLYGIPCGSRTEAHYLCAMVNSSVVSAAIAHDQPRGQFGARHIHRRPVELVPIPTFDPEAEDHLRLAALSDQAHAAAQTIEFNSQRNRQRYVDALGAPVEEIDAIAARLLE